MSRKCAQCGAPDAPLYDDLGVRLCDENCKACFLSDHPKFRSLESLAEES